MVAEKKQKSIAGYIAKEANNLKKLLAHNPEQAEEARLIAVAMKDPERVKKFVAGL